MGEKMSFKQKLQVKKESQFQEMLKEQQQNQKEQQELQEELKEHFDEKFLMAKQNINAVEIPKLIQRRAQQVFSKYHVKDIRDMGQNFINLYQKLHQGEKPQDYLTVDPFISSFDIKKDLSSGANDYIYLRDSKLSKVEADALAEKKRQERVQKQKENREKTEKARQNSRQDDEDIDELNIDNRFQQKEQTNEEIIRKQNQENPNQQLLKYNQNMAIAYLLRKLPGTYAVQKRIINEIKKRLPEFQPTSFLDYGAGLGQSSHIINEYYPDLKKQILLEPSTVMRKLGKHITQDIENNLWVDNLARMATIPNTQSFDLILCSFVLEEVPSAYARQLIIDTLWNKLSKNGILIFISPGSPMGSRFTHDVRNHILNNKSESDPYIIAPCAHQGKCPLAQNKETWCHFEQKYYKYKKDVFPKKNTENNYGTEKYSYVVIQKGKNFEFDIDNYEEIQQLETWQQSFSWNRILFPSIKKGGHIILNLCSNEGEYERRIITKSHKEFGPKGYKELKKLNWGDFWRFEKRIPNKFRKEGLRGKRLW
ncbi:hypothetical protein PPERSA_09116 [Pseudocohnilembus persalinus]|uniref:Uncharacterized protein n=1 Tax=Pseudocohnilembus persalinus TaxID=266149 RepID=A0A0V0QXC4_PSEPJ|nr:hypothetical protein PPERSA_09116 [Pseudocohnilembus persalinus]|eukprot:KRX06714.1 hypothetical protein PPERSA_09116 [Pseudocohnilembus persalinus]